MIIKADKLYFAFIPTFGILTYLFNLKTSFLCFFDLKLSKALCLKK